GKELFVFDGAAGAAPQHQIRVRVVTELAWHNAFARNLLLRRQAEEGPFASWSLIYAPGFQAVPERDGTRSEAFIGIDFSRRLVLIVGTRYAGELKKSVFTIMNGVLPERGVLPMHCGANVGAGGDVALFFGLSGTGKTTLSADGDRRLIGDDEHGWSADGIFNFEGGCYAKVVNLSQVSEPELYAASQRFGTVLENVKVDPVSRLPDYVDIGKTENTRAAYPLEFMPNASAIGVGEHPADVVFLTADAFGVLPPISRLDVPQAMYQFLSGYTAKVAGTERGVSEPTATFSACFAAPFMPLAPVAYAEMLGDRLRKHGSRAWLVNTGWAGGGYGSGSRIALAATRCMVRAALSGALEDAPTKRHEHFGLDYVTAVPGVDTAILDARGSWADGAAYDEAATKLAKMFVKNFERFAAQVPPEVLAAGPR